MLHQLAAHLKHIVKYFSKNTPWLTCVLVIISKIHRPAYPYLRGAIRRVIVQRHSGDVVAVRAVSVTMGVGWIER